MGHKTPVNSSIFFTSTATGQNRSLNGSKGPRSGEAGDSPLVGRQLTHVDTPTSLAAAAAAVAAANRPERNRGLEGRVAGS